MSRKISSGFGYYVNTNLGLNEMLAHHISIHEHTPQSTALKSGTFIYIIGQHVVF